MGARNFSIKGARHLHISRIENSFKAYLELVATYEDEAAELNGIELLMGC